MWRFIDSLKNKKISPLNKLLAKCSFRTSTEKWNALEFCNWITFNPYTGLVYLLTWNYFKRCRFQVFLKWLLVMQLCKHDPCYVDKTDYRSLHTVGLCLTLYKYRYLKKSQAYLQYYIFIRLLPLNILFSFLSFCWSHVSTTYFTFYTSVTTSNEITPLNERILSFKVGLQANVT